MKLNSDQQAAVDSTSQNLVTVAGPGSGKSSTLVARVLKLIARGARPRDIVVITYTVAAARELQNRLRSQGMADRLGYVGTLHSFILGLLRKHHALGNVPEAVTVIDDEAREAVVERLRADMKVKDSLAACLAAVNDERYSLPVPPGSLLKKHEVLAVEYHRTLRRNALVDFNTILWGGARLARQLDSTELCHKHLLVDEYQDASNGDDALYMLLPFETRFFVGDPDQAIYGFRGGNVQNFILKVEEPGVAAQVARWQVHLLEKNYRSTPQICGAAQNLIVKNRARVDKATVSEQAVGEPVVVSQNETEGEERARVLRFVAFNWMPRKFSVAVLCRTNRLATELAQFLRDGGVEVVQRKRAELPPDWRAAKLYLALMANPWNDFVAHQWLAETQGVQRANEIRNGCALNHKSINDAELRVQRPQPGALLKSDLFFRLSFPSQERLTATFAGLGPDATVEDLVFALARLEEAHEESGVGVTVTTMHSSKGREWDAVFIAGCEEETFFGSGTDSATDAVEEERRLFYVAMTRARSELVLSWCTKRPLYRGPNVRPGPPEPRTRSRFIAEAGL